MAMTSNFALRTTPEIKSALKALTEAHFSTRDGEAILDTWGAGTMNFAANLLLERAMKALLPGIEQELVRERARHDALQEIMRFLLDNPAAQTVMVVNLPKGSAGRAWLEAEFTYAYEHLEGEEAEEGEAQRVADLTDGKSRAEIAYELHGAAHRLQRLTEAKGAIQRVASAGID